MLPDSNEVCRYYKELCEATGGADEYACTTCCKDFDSYGTYDDIMCIRQCLIDDDIEFHKFTDISASTLSELRIGAHIHCYIKCPGGVTVGYMIFKKGLSPSCWDASKILGLDSGLDALDVTLFPFGSALREIYERFK